MSAMLKLSYLWQSNKATITTKLRMLNACVKRILCTMHNCGQSQQKRKKT